MQWVKIHVIDHMMIKLYLSDEVVDTFPLVNLLLQKDIFCEVNCMMTS